MNDSKEIFSKGFLFAIPAVTLLMLENVWTSIQFVIVAFTPNTGLGGLVVVYIPFLLGAIAIYGLLMFGLLQRNSYATLGSIFFIPYLYYYEAQTILQPTSINTIPDGMILTLAAYTFKLIAFLSAAVFILEWRDNLKRSNSLKN
jgi:hypothetical protein